MKRIMVLLITLFLLVCGVNADQNDAKTALNRVKPSLVKVISQSNQFQYVATGIAVESDLVISSSLITRYPYTRLYVQTTSGDDVSAKVTGNDNESSLILLKLNRAVLKPVKRAKGAEVGDWVALVGSFYDTFPSVNQGLVSRSSATEMIIDAPVFPGASGGAVVNKKGELLAVIRGRFSVALVPKLSFKDHQSEIVVSSGSPGKSLCLAVPVEKVWHISDHLKRFGRVKRGWLGVSLESNPLNNILVVAGITVDSPADKMGLIVGDIITSIEGIEPADIDHAGSLIKAVTPGDTMKLRVKRDGKLRKLSGRVGELEAAQVQLLRGFTPAGESTIKRGNVPELYESIPRQENFVISMQQSRSIGVDTVPVSSRLADSFKVTEGSGLLVSDVAPGGPAESAGIRAGDIIVRMMDQPIREYADLRNIMNGLRENQPVNVELYRDKRKKRFKLVPVGAETAQPVWERFDHGLQSFFTRFGNEASRLIYQQQLDLARRELSRLEKTRQLVGDDEIDVFSRMIEQLFQSQQKELLRSLKNLDQQKSRLNSEMDRFTAEVRKIRKRIESLKKKDKNIIL